MTSTILLIAALNGTSVDCVKLADILSSVAAIEAVKTGAPPSTDIRAIKSYIRKCQELQNVR